MVRLVFSDLCDDEIGASLTVWSPSRTLSEDLDAVVARGDAAMYEAKSRGRAFASRSGGSSTGRQQGLLWRLGPLTLTASALPNLSLRLLPGYPVGNDEG